MKFIAAFEAEIDTMLLTFVTNTSASMAGVLGGLAAGGITIYMMFMAYAIARGEIQEPMSKLTKEVLSMAIIATIATGVGVYQAYVISGAQAVLALLTSGVSQTNAQSIGELIDSFWAISAKVDGQTLPAYKALWVMAKKDSNSIGIPNLSYFFAALLVFASTIVLAICCLLPAILAKIGLSLMLAIGPLFIMLAIIPYTRNYFASWLSNMLGNLMTLVLVACITSAAVNLFCSTLEKQLANLSYVESSPLTVGLILIIISAALGIASLHVSQVGAQLAGGGVALDSKGLAGNIVQAMLSNKKKDPGGDGGSKPQNSISQTPYSAGKRMGQMFSSKKG
jgi:type IV secretion system protein VirB6